MKKMLLIALFAMLAVSMMLAQNTYSPSTDVLGGHLNHGRGCAGCHAPHSGARGNGTATTDPLSGAVALWGGDLGPLYGKVLGFGDGGKTITVLPANVNGDSHMGGTDPRVGGILLCLGCHDGNATTRGPMMTGQVYETLPAGVYGTNPIPTLLGNDGSTLGYANDHPVGENAAVSCTGSYNWDCTVNANGSISMNGTNSSKFVLNYGQTAKTSAYNGTTPIVICTTCHNQHVMNVYKGTVAGLAGTFQTYFGIKGAYNPGSTAVGANTTAQFCRQCHGGEANESNNSTAGTTF